MGWVDTGGLKTSCIPKNNVNLFSTVRHVPFCQSASSFPPPPPVFTLNTAQGWSVVVRFLYVFGNHVLPRIRTLSHHIKKMTLAHLHSRLFPASAASLPCPSASGWIQPCHTEVDQCVCVRETVCMCVFWTRSPVLCCCMLLCSVSVFLEQ